MKKFGKCVSALSTITGIILFIVMATRSRNTAVKDMKPYLIGFAICVVISALTQFCLKLGSSGQQNTRHTDSWGAADHVGSFTDKEWTRQVNEQQAQQFMQQNQQAVDDAVRAGEEARLAGTGVEFGGYNTDPNMNPGMSFFQDNQFFQDNSFFSNNNGFNNF